MRLQISPVITPVIYYHLMHKDRYWSTWKSTRNNNVKHHTKHISLAKKFEQKTNIIGVTAHNDDFVYITVIFNIYIYTSTPCKKAITDIDKPNDEIYSIIEALVVNIHQRTQTEKTLLDNFSMPIRLRYLIKNSVFSVCVRWCISIATARMTPKIPPFHSLILGIHVLRCSDW